MHNVHSHLYFQELLIYGCCPHVELLLSGCECFPPHLNMECDAERVISVDRNVRSEAQLSDQSKRQKNRKQAFISTRSTLSVKFGSHFRVRFSPFWVHAETIYQYEREMLLQDGQHLRGSSFFKVGISGQKISLQLLGERSCCLSKVWGRYHVTRCP